MRWVVWVAILLSPIGATSADPAIYIWSGAPDETRQAALELQRVIHAATGEALPVTASDRVGAEADGFVLGSIDSFPTGVPPFPFGESAPSHDGFVIADQAELKLIGAPTPAALMNAVGHIGEALGSGIALDRFVAPEDASELDEVAASGSFSPKHAVRAIAPRLDVPFGAPAWNIADWKQYIDNARLLGFNTLYLDLHQSTPYRDAPSRCTSLPANAAALPSFGIDGYFTPNDPLVTHPISPENAQPVLGQATAYAAGRGMSVVAAIEAMGNPLDTVVTDRTREQIQHLVRTYPGIDRIAVALGDPGAVLTRAHDPLGLYAQHLSTDLGSADADAARLIIFATTVRQYAATLNNGIDVTVRGGIGPTADSWNGILRELGISPGDAFMHGADSNASIAMIELESRDGLWMPRAVLRYAEEFVSKAGDAGYVVSHATLRQSSIATRYVARYSWNQEADATDYAIRFLHSEDAEEVAELLRTCLYAEAVKGGPTGRDGAYANEPITYDTAAGAEYAEALSALAELVDAPPSLHGSPGADEDVIEAGLETVLSVGTAPLRIFTGRRGSADAFGDPMAELYAQLFYALPLAQTLSRASAGETNAARIVPAMHLFAHGMRTKTDLALLASLSGMYAVGDTLESGPPESLRKLHPVWLLPDRVIAFTESAEAKVVLKWREVGESRWNEAPCESLGGYTFAWQYPAEARGKAIEYGVEVGGGLRTTSSAPYGFPSNVATAVVHTPDVPKSSGRTAPSITQLQVSAKALPNGLNELTWSSELGEHYHVYRDGEKIIETPMAFYIDAPATDLEVRYELVAHDLSSDETHRVVAMAPPAVGPSPDSPETLEIASRSNKAILTWKAVEGAAQYRIKNIDTDDESIVPADAGQRMRTSIPVGAEDSASFEVTAIGASGSRAATSLSAGILIESKGIEPRLLVDLNSPTFFEVIAALGEAGTFIGGPGLTEGPNPTPLQEDSRLTLSAWVNLDTKRGRPILLSQGLWPEPQLVLRIRRGVLELDLDDGTRIRGGVPKAKQWHHVAVVIFEDTARIYLDGVQVARGVRGKAVVPLRLSDTEVPPTALFTNGTIDRIALYTAALTAEEIAELAASDPPSAPPEE